MSEIIYVCSSVNNKNIRERELKILRKNTYHKISSEYVTTDIN